MRWINKLKNKKIIFTFLLLILILSHFWLFLSLNNTRLNYATNSSKEPNLKNNEILTSSNGDDNNKSVIVFFNDPIYDNKVKDNFTDFGGKIIEEWNNNTFNSISGFAGILPEDKIIDFQTTWPDATIEEDQIIEAQMNYASVQTEATNSSWYLNGYKGDTNSSIAVLDSGVNPYHEFFQDGYDPDDLKGTIVGWENFVNSESVSDDLGHGTFISSVIAGTGTDNSNNSTTVKLYGNYTHTGLFGGDYIAPKNYTLKIFSFNVSRPDSNIIINSTWNSIEDGIDQFWIELYNDTELVNRSENLEPNELNIMNHTIVKSGTGIYDLHVKYHKTIATDPTFSYSVNVTFYPESFVENRKHFTGIANGSKIVSYKILNQSGLGYTHDLISALASVISNKSKYHIISVCLAIKTLGSEVKAINAIIDEVIENGILVIIAAGNSGIEGSDPINQLALNKNAIVVGAINDLDEITSYSSMGKDVGDGVIKPDIVAPGGSKIPGHRSIIGADYKSNKTTAAYGTSIAAAIVAASINILVEAKWGNWKQWEKLDLSERTKYIKAILLMTASETNLERENDPDTVIDESDYSPTRYLETSNTDLKDSHEGYGRLNVQAAIDALTKFMEVNTTIDGTLNSSEENPLGTHVFARRINLTANTQYLFNLSFIEEDADYDIYLFSNSPNQYGEPILLGSSRKYYGDFSSFYFTPKGNETECIMTIKAISESGNFTLNISAVKNSLPPELDVPKFLYEDDSEEVFTTVLSRQEYLGNNPGGNYTIDSYRFYINYTDNDISNAPPQDIYVCIDGTNNYSLYRAYPILENNFSEGVLYWSDYINFSIPKMYKYYFFVSDGAHQVTYPESSNLSISIEYHKNIESIPYVYSFNNGLNNWNYTGTSWGELTQHNSNDDRSRIYSNNWKSLYFGTYHENPKDYTYQPDRLGDPWPNGTLISPVFNLTMLDENTQPFARFGLRVSINAEDFVYLQILQNWSDWKTLKTYSNEEIEWFIEEINLTEYKGNLIQFRFETEINDIYDPVKYRGFMVDYLSIKNYTNENSPEITFMGISPDKDSEYAKFTFKCLYSDLDNNYPEFVYIEINGKNNTMHNTYGDWISEDNGIYFKKSLIVSDMSNRAFRFHISDGEHLLSSNWYNDDDTLIKFTNPDPIKFNFYQSGKSIGYEFENDEMDEYFIAGTPIPEDSTAWLIADTNWHTIYRYGQDILYAGIGHPSSYGEGNRGYGENWDAKLITRPLELGNDYDLCLEFNYDISIQPETLLLEPDECIISISTNYGEDWTELKEYTPNTEELSGTEEIDLSEYADEIVMIMFTLHSNDQETLKELALGWFLYDIYIGYDKSSDFEDPEIDIRNLEDNDIVDSVVTIEVHITDNDKIDDDRIFVYIGDKSVSEDDMEFDEGDDILEIKWDTRTYANGEYDIEIIVFDEEGNEETEMITVIVQNGLIDWHTWGSWIIFAISLLFIVIAIILFIVIKRSRSQKIRKTRKIDKDQAIKSIKKIEKEELNRPLILYCKFCNSWFSSDESKFDIMCSECGHDQIYAAYICVNVNCGRWYFFDEPNEDYHCKKKKCKGLRLVRQEKEVIEKILGKKGITLKKFEFESKSKYDILNL